MPFSSTLPVMAGLSILGAALGITLGRDAISEINPAYFNAAEDDFHADLVPYRSADWAQVQQAEYRAAQQPVVVGELGTGCVGCRDYPIAYVPRHDPAVDFYADSGVETSAPQPAQVVVMETPAPDPARERIQLYSSYPVSSEERPVEVAEAPVEEVAAPTGL
ncbi:MAG TPA: hypothetical protein VE053_11040 [Allosphingosinicella sp.]|nr:hypothetical protein [Allosphingosinicella sp.]